MSERTYAGTADGTVVVRLGEHTEPLRHYVRHSPDGFSWGYGGSGPADLARCLLIDAMGREARCGMCGGTGVVVLVDGEEMSVAQAETEVPNFEWARHAFSCNLCEDGVVVDPSTYQSFKFDVIAKLPVSRPWEMGQEDVLAWLASYTSDRAQAVTVPDGRAP